MIETSQIEWERKLSDFELQKMFEESRRPGVFLRKTPKFDDPGLSGSWIGGQPRLPDFIDWPEYISADYPKIPMSFVAQISLRELQECSVFPFLPSEGTLFFFLDLAFAPTEYLPAGSAKVIFVEEDVSSYPFRRAPDVPDLSDYKHLFYPEFSETDYKIEYRKWAVTFHSFETVETRQFQNRQFWKAASELDENVFSQIEKLTRSDRKKSGHDGWSKSFFSRHFMFGVSGRAEGDHISLLTLSNDHDIQFGYPESIPISFQISKQEIKQLNFSNVSFSLQD